MKKLFIILVCVVLVGQMFVTYAEDYSEWAEEGLVEVRLLNIFSDEIFEEFNSNISRGEFIRIAVEMYEAFIGSEVVVDDNIKFSDTNDIYALKGASVGITSGIGNGEFGFNQELTREQLATFMIKILRLLGIEQLVENPKVFNDDIDISSWAKESVYKARENDIISGVGNNMFDPQGKATKEAALIIAKKIVLRYADQDIRIGENYLKSQVLSNSIILLDEIQSWPLDSNGVSLPNNGLVINYLGKRLVYQELTPFYLDTNLELYFQDEGEFLKLLNLVNGEFDDFFEVVENTTNLPNLDGIYGAGTYNFNRYLLDLDQHEILVNEPEYGYITYKFFFNGNECSVKDDNRNERESIGSKSSEYTKVGYIKSTNNYWYLRPTPFKMATAWNVNDLLDALGVGKNIRLEYNQENEWYEMFID